ncbi:MAG: tetratricopeptide repeat protein [Myxococcota bacterium]
MKPISLFLVIALTLVCACSSGRVARPYYPPIDLSARDWIEVETPTFRVRSDAPPEAARVAATELERFAGLLSRATQVVPTERATVYAIADPKVLAAVLPDFARGVRANIHSGGLIVAPIQNVDDTRATLSHEIVHELMAQQRIRYPTWYTEGLAEFLESTQVRHDLATIGRPETMRAMALAARGRIPVWQLLDPTHSPHEDLHAYYANAWLVVHYLHTGRRPSGESPLDAGVDYLERLAVGEPWRSAFETAFGTSLAAFDEEVEAHLEFLKTRYRLIDFEEPIPEDEPEMEVRTLAPEVVAAQLAEATIQFGHYRAAAALALVAPWYRDPEAPRANAVFGLAEATLGVTDRASRAVDVALASAPDDPAVLQLAGDVAYRLAVNEKQVDRERLREARTRYERSRRLGSTTPGLEWRIARTFGAGLPGDDLETRREIVERALTRYPEDGQLLLGLARIHVDAGREEEARRLLRTVIDGNWYPGLREEARRRLEALGEPATRS